MNGCFVISLSNLYKSSLPKIFQTRKPSLVTTVLNDWKICETFTHNGWKYLPALSIIGSCENKDSHHPFLHLRARPFRALIPVAFQFILK